MPSPTLSTHARRLSLLAVSAVLASGAYAQSAAPTDAGAPQAQPGDAAPDTGAEATQGAEAAASAEGAAAAPSATPGIAVLARWLRTSSCRIFITFPMDENTRFSPTTRGKRHVGWRISLPSFAGALLSTSGEPAEDAPGAEAAGSADIAGASPEPGVQALVQQQPTWTQRVGLVKADAPTGPAAGAEGVAGAPAQPTWTQRVGLVKSPSSTAPAAEGVASFSKKKTADAGEKE